MLKEPITLPILWHTDESIQLNELGIDSKDTTIKKVTFYSIDHIYPYNHEGLDYTKVSSGGIDYIATDKVGSINLAIISRLS